MLGFIEENLFSESLTVADIKRSCSIANNAVALVFHRRLGKPPKAYIQEMRLSVAAKILIEYPQIKVWQVAELVGFSSVGVFSKAFERWSHMRPNAYRKQMWALDNTGVSESGLEPIALSRVLQGDAEEAEVTRLLRILVKKYPQASREVLQSASV